MPGAWEEELLAMLAIVMVFKLTPIVMEQTGARIATQAANDKRSVDTLFVQVLGVDLVPHARSVAAKE